MFSLFADSLPAAAPEFSGIDGFLGTRGSLMMDIVVLAMFAVVPVMAISIYLAKYHRLYRLHKRIQITLGAVLLVAVALFELDIQYISQWEQRAEPSPYFAVAEQWSCPAGISLVVHLTFAVPTAVLWVYVILAALRNFPSPPAPGPYSRRHIFWARLAAFEMVMTAVTGWTFYVLAFVL